MHGEAVSMLARGPGVCVPAQVACVQFINIVVHSVENMNFRVFLQYEFTNLGLDLCLEVSPVPCGPPLAPGELQHSRTAAWSNSFKSWLCCFLGLKA